MKSTTGTTYYFKKDNARCLDEGRQPITSKNGQRYFLLTTKKCTLNGYKIDLADNKSAYSFQKICQPNDNSITCSAARKMGLYNESDIKIVYNSVGFRLNLASCDKDCKQIEKMRNQYWNNALYYLKQDRIDLACENWLGAYRYGHLSAEINLRKYECGNF